ncbi:hypothetical protein N9571_02400 [Yoonia sp.]|nr:hypothetical protein [Yoonia sp.]
MAEVFGGVEFVLRHAQHEVLKDVCSMFHLFCIRYNELRANMADLRGFEARFTMSFAKNDGQVTAKGQSKFNPHRLKGLFLDYRPFAAQREITHFAKVCNQVRKYFPDPEVMQMIEEEKATWAEDNFSEWHGRAFDEIADTLFNASLFHNDIERQADLAELTSAFDDLALQSVLFLGVDRRLAAIRNVAFIIGACTEKHHTVRVPISKLIQKKDVP